MVAVPKISVVIPTYNRVDSVCLLVASVLAAGWENIEVVVVDDCSPDNIISDGVRQVYAADSRVRCVRNPRNSLQTVSRNHGARVSTGDYVVFLDDDTRVHPGLFDELLACFKRHSDAGLVAPVAIHNRPGMENLVWSMGSDFNRWTSQPRDYLANLPLSEFNPDRQDYPTTYYPAAFMVPREVLQKTGGLDESYVTVFEESDFGWRILECGYKGYVTVKARIDHLGYLDPGTVSELRLLGIHSVPRTYYLARNRLKFVRRHFSFLQLLSVTFIFAPLSVLWYSWIAIRNRRWDIAWAYVRGTVVGVMGLFRPDECQRGIL